MRFYAFTVDYFKFALSANLRRKTFSFLQFNSLRLYFWLLLKRSRKLMHSFGSLFSKIFYRYYRTMSEYLNFLMFTRKSWFMRLCYSAVLRIRAAPRALPFYETRAEVSALRILFYQTYKKFNLFACNSNADVLRKMRGYLKFMLLLKHSTVKVFLKKLGEAFSAVFVPSNRVRTSGSSGRLFKREALNFLFNNLMKARLTRILGFPKREIDRVLNRVRKFFFLSAGRGFFGKRLISKLCSLFKIFLGASSSMGRNKTHLFNVFTRLLKFLAVFYKKRQASCVSLLHSEHSSFKFLGLTSFDLKASYLLKQRVRFIADRIGSVDLRVGGRKFAERASILRKFRFRDSSLRALFRDKIRTRGFDNSRFDDSSPFYRIAVIKLLLHLGEGLSSRVLELHGSNLNQLVLDFRQNFLLNFRARHIYELFCALRTLSCSTGLSSKVFLPFPDCAALLSNVWAARSFFFDVPLPFLNNSYAVSDFVRRGGLGCLSVQGLASNSSDFAGKNVNVENFARGILLAASPVSVKYSAEIFNFANLLAVILGNSPELGLYRSVVDHFSFQQRFITAFVSGFLYSFISAARGAVFDAFTTHLRSVLYTLGLR